MVFQVHVSLLFRFGVHISLVCRERHFGIHHDVPVVREVQDEVGYKPFPLVVLNQCSERVPQMLLRVVLLPVFQPEVFEQLFQFHLPEVSLRLDVACEGFRQSGGSLFEVGVVPHIRLNCRVEFRQGVFLLLFRAVECLAHEFQALLQGVDDFRHLLHVLFSQFLLPCFQNRFGCGSHLFADEGELAVHLLLVHVLQRLYLFLCRLLYLLQLFLVRRRHVFCLFPVVGFQLFELHFRVLCHSGVDVALCRRLPQAVVEALCLVFKGRDSAFLFFRQLCQRVAFLVAVLLSRPQT